MCIGRTPSAVAMKLSNLASLDPALKLRGIKGLAGASILDRAMWEEFHANPAELVPLSQERFDSLFIGSEEETTEVVPNIGIRRFTRPRSSETEILRTVKQRRGQNYFPPRRWHSAGSEFPRGAQKKTGQIILKLEPMAYTREREKSLRREMVKWAGCGGHALPFLAESRVLPEAA